jgi:Holliday junction resolvase RusA-like endonuclease
MKTRLPLPPLSTNHSYHTSNGRWYKDEQMTVWEDECLYKLKRVKKPFSPQSSYTVEIDFYFGNKRKNDIDGRIKGVLDMLGKAGFYPDDSLITRMIVSKQFDRENPRLEVLVY